MTGERQNAAGQIAVSPTANGPTANGQTADGQTTDGRSRRNVTVSGRRTSVSLEAPVWDVLAEFCDASLASAARVFALGYFRSRAERPRGGPARSTLETLLQAYASTHR